MTVRDGEGDPVQGDTLTFQATSSDNTLSQPSGTTGPDVIATGTLGGAVPGTKVISAPIDGSVQVSQTAQVIVTPAPAAGIEPIEGDDQSALAGTPVPVRPAVRVSNDLGGIWGALPQTASAVVNCRMLPDERKDDVLAAVRAAVADSAVAVTVTQEPMPSPPSPLTPEVLQPIERLTAAMWPGAAVVPSMETGATDGLYLSADADDNRAHGRDERIRVPAFYASLDYMNELVRALASGGKKHAPARP